MSAPIAPGDVQRGDLVSWDIWPGRTVTDTITVVERGPSGVPYRAYLQDSWCIEASAHVSWSEVVALLNCRFTRPTDTHNHNLNLNLN